MASAQQTKDTYVVREGSNTVGLLFQDVRAVFFPRGWIKELRMPEGGPRTFSLLINGQSVAQTTNGVITRNNFTEEALEDISQKTSPSDLFLRYNKYSDYVNLSFQGRIMIIANEPPLRQQYFVQMTWAQILKKVPERNSNTDMDFEEVPVIGLFNLRSEDRSATIHRTVPLQVK